ncbi:MAG TPA: nuclear transport factor 2 family protein [Pyrinomonadaceae bacterium]|jgi:ketosteroid isomerase-like protein
MSDEQPGAQPSKIQTEQLLRQMNDDWVKAVVRRDAETLERVMAEDFVFTYPLEGDDRAQFISDVMSGDLKIEQLTRHQVNVRIYGGTAVLTARDSAKWTYRGRHFEGQYKVIQVYSERDNRWQLVAVQVCTIA